MALKCELSRARLVEEGFERLLQGQLEVLALFEGLLHELVVPRSAKVIGQGTWAGKSWFGDQFAETVEAEDTGLNYDRLPVAAWAFAPRSWFLPASSASLWPAM